MFHSIRSLALGLACLIPGALAAQCVTDADLARGIQVEFANGDTTTHRRLNDGYIEVVERYTDGNPPIRFRSHRGVYFTEEIELDPNGQGVPSSLLRVEFPQDPATLPDPRPGVNWEGQTMNVFADGGRRPETFIAAFSEGPTLALSGCDYASVQLDLRYDWGADGGLSLVYYYLPTVGTAIIRSNQFDGDTMNETEAVAISRMSK